MHFCPTCHTELLPCDHGGVAAVRCTGCEGLFFESDRFERALGGPVDLLPFPVEPPPRCPGCEGPMDSVSLGEHEWLSCSECEGHWLSPATLESLRAAVPDARPLPTAPQVVDSAPLDVVSDRIGFAHPLVRLLAFPLVGLLGTLLAVYRIAEAPTFFVRLWVHELGHATPAWLSGRAALPLPVGFTFWREESSWFTAACLFFLIAVFGVASVRERKVFGIAIASGLLVVQAICTLIVPAETMLEWILAGGLAGELVISTAFIVSFYYPLPDRLRWDFWRFFVLVPAGVAFAGAFVMWMRIERGEQSLPFGNILGAPGDGSGDVERLLRDCDWTESGMIALYRSLAVVCLGIIGAHYALFGIHAFIRRRREARNG